MSNRDANQVRANRFAYHHVDEHEEPGHVGCLDGQYTHDVEDHVLILAAPHVQDDDDERFAERVLLQWQRDSLNIVL